MLLWTYTPGVLRFESRWLRWIVSSLALGLLGCASAPPAPKARPAAPTVTTEAFLTAFLERFEASYRRALSRSVSVAAVMQTQLAALPASTKGEPDDSALLRLVYLGAAPRLRFADASAPNKGGELLLQRLRAAHQDALDPTRYGLANLEAARRTLQERVADRRLVTPTLRERRETLPLWNAIERLGPAGRRAPGAQRTLQDRVLAPKGPLPTLARAFAAACEARREQLQAQVRLELVLARAFARFSRDLGRANTLPAALQARWRWEATTAGKAYVRAKRRGRAPTSLPASAPLVLRDAPAWLLQAQAKDLASIHDLASLRARLAAAEPPHPQYRKLLAARERYLAYVKTGGWKRLRYRRALRRGRRHRLVAELRARLAAEGFGILDEAAKADADLFEAKLEAAIEAFQRAHQLKDSGRVDRQLYRSLARGAADKLANIEKTIARWRQSSVAASSTYVLINVPDFHLEVWRAGKRLARHKLVVGRAKGTKCDEASKRRVLRYATPLQSARLEYLMIAPYWNVTPEIKQVELDPERAKDSLYYEKNGYEVLKSGTPQEWVRQLPGPGNSLGFVKFIFPNPHATFVHDTPEKSLFQRTLRAYSHGCMRVDEPWALAKVVLSVDGQWDEGGYQRVYKDWRSMREVRTLRENWDADLYETLREKATKLERKVELRKPLAVHVEYYTVRVDDRGRTIFLHDVYGLEGRGVGVVDRRVGWRCVPESKQAKKGFAELLTRVAEIEKRALAVGPALTQAALAVQLLDRRQRRRHYWLVRQIEKKLGRFSEHHANLARNIKNDFATLEQALEEAGGRWKGALTRRAVRLLRLFAALESMTARAELVAKMAAKLPGVKAAPKVPAEKAPER